MPWQHTWMNVLITQQRIFANETSSLIRSREALCLLMIQIFIDAKIRTKRWWGGNSEGESLTSNNSRNYLLPQRQSKLIHFSLKFSHLFVWISVVVAWTSGPWRLHQQDVNVYISSFCLFLFHCLSHWLHSENIYTADWKLRKIETDRKAFKAIYFE